MVGGRGGGGRVSAECAAGAGRDTGSTDDVSNAIVEDRGDDEGDGSTGAAGVLPPEVGAAGEAPPPSLAAILPPLLSTGIAAPGANPACGAAGAATRVGADTDSGDDAGELVKRVAAAAVMLSPHAARRSRFIDAEHRLLQTRTPAYAIASPTSK